MAQPRYRIVTGTVDESFALYDDAKWRADELAAQTGRVIEVLADGSVVYRTGQASR